MNLILRLRWRIFQITWLIELVECCDSDYGIIKLIDIGCYRLLTGWACAAYKRFITSMYKFSQTPSFSLKLPFAEDFRTV